MSELLESYPVVIEVPVRWGDMDAFNHVNNVVYFQYFETARIVYFERIHVMKYLKQTGIGPILASTQCRYRFPVTYPDTLLVGAKVTDIGDDRFTQQYLAVSHAHQTIAAEGEGVIVAFDYRGNTKIRLPREIETRIHDMENCLMENNR